MTERRREWRAVHMGLATPMGEQMKEKTKKTQKTALAKIIALPNLWQNDKRTSFSEWENQIVAKT